MLVLGLESSCDETAAALVEDGRTLLADVISTQMDIHRRWGGVVPELASRNHLSQIFPVIEEALRRADKRLDQVDVIGATRGPGLVGALLIAWQVAKTLSWALERPLIGVNHLEGHILATRLSGHAPEPPYLALVVSGGHTTLYDVERSGSHRRVASTRDDAAGEAYDKVARILGLPYPGGRPIDDLARGGDPEAVRFPRGLSGREELDWSFSGLKTSVLNHVRKHGHPEGQRLADLCASFQEAVADALTSKLIRAATGLGREQLLICGGVACNSRLRSLATERAARHGLELFLPPPRLCTDNGAMIAVAAHEAYVRGERTPLDSTAAPAWRL